MRRLIAIGFAVILLLAPAMTGCKRKRKASVAGVGQDAPGEPATMLSTIDPRAALQLTKGFYEVENGSWRWSSKEFSAALKPPANSAQKGAILDLKFSVVDASIAKLGPLTLTARVGGTECPAQRYDKAGQYEYHCDVPASSLVGTLVNTDFALDKVLPATDTDQRTLGLVVAMVGFEAK
jgi:hypothetical protein